MAKKKCNCPIKGPGNERKCFNSWWGPGDGRCTCHCHDVEEDLFNRAEGMRLAQEGAQRALDHANQASKGWGERALGFVDAYALNHEGTFMAEDVRHEAYAQGFEKPAEERAWGGIMLKAAKSGKIIRVGFGRSRAKNVHANPATVWRGAKQSE